MIQRFKNWFRHYFTQQGSLSELESELHVRRPEARPGYGSWRETAIQKRKTLSGAVHKHRSPGCGRRRRGYLPAVKSGRVGLRRYRSCRFVFARIAREAFALRFRNIWQGDRIATAITNARLEKKGLRVAVA
jgi:hypothetical protein